MTFEIPEYDLSEVVSIETFTKTNPALFNAAILNALYNGITLNLESCPAFSFKGTNDCFSIEKKDYSEKIEICLTFFEEMEEYEICKTLIELKDKL